jgi:hypothetical protein
MGGLQIFGMRLGCKGSKAIDIAPSIFSTSHRKKFTINMSITEDF